MNKVLIIIGCCVFAICCFAVGGYIFIQSEIQKPFLMSVAEPSFEVFEIKENEGSKDIAINLEKEGLIKNNLFFLFYFLTKEKNSNLQYGKYCLSPTQNIPEIFEKLKEGKTISDYISLTFPEGWRVSQIEGRLEESGLVSESDIRDLRIRDFKKDFSFLKGASDSVSLEGYLFPDTYFFSCDSSEILCDEEKILKCKEGNLKEIVQKFLLNFDEKLTTDLREEIARQGKSVFDIITMASILEKEVQSLRDKKIASGVFWKRVEENQSLNSCATIVYIMEGGDWSFEEMRKEVAKGKEIDSLYNTYKIKGLPAGPISNPGIDSIRAAVFPEFTDYNYFLTDPEAGETIFSKTLEEHNQNKAKYFP